MNTLSRILLFVCIFWAFLPGAATLADASPEEKALTEQVRLALIDPDATLADAMAAYDADIPSRLPAAINILSLGADPTTFTETDDPYLTTVQQVRAETRLLNLTPEQIEDRVRFYELNRTGYVLMSVYDRPSDSGDLVDLDPEIDILVVVVNFWDMRIGTMVHDDLYSMKVVLHPVFATSRLPELSGSRACHLGAYAVPARSLAVYIIPSEGPD